jgi:hypothetical protein
MRGTRSVPIPRSTRRWILEVEAKENPGDQQAHLHVALAYAAMGWQDAALAEIARAKDISQMDGRWRRFWSMRASATPHCAYSSSFLRQIDSLAPK